MSRRPFIVGNWKMNTGRESGAMLTVTLCDQLKNLADVDVAICPPSIYIPFHSELLTGSSIALGAQNVSPEPNGAFTGEISLTMLSEFRCKYVIIGHSERRQHFGESDELINRKVKAVLEANLLPILCVGETLAEREADQTEGVVERQLRNGLVGVPPELLRQVTIAYEPVWAIGTGKVATPEQAEQVHSSIRNLITRLYGTDLAQVVRIQYGGSVKPDNAAGLLSQPNIDGALVGGASLQAEDFIAIVNTTIEQQKSQS